jgi:hypothetical protein
MLAEKTQFLINDNPIVIGRFYAKITIAVISDREVSEAVLLFLAMKYPPPGTLGSS